MNYLRLMRPAQWTKNLFLLAGMVFGHKLFVDGAIQWPILATVIAGMACFSLISSGVYMFNDIRDQN